MKHFSTAGLILLLTISSLYPQTGFAQQGIEHPGVRNPGITIIKGDEILESRQYDLNEISGFIIQFKEPALAETGKHLQDESYSKSSIDVQIAARKSTMENEHQQFRSDVEELRSSMMRKQSGTLKDAGVSYQHDFYTVFNGVSLETTRWLADEIAGLPYVKHVHERQEVRAHTEEAAEVIGAPDLWNEFGATGEGIIVGILDTGIDYTHPDLGGGIGPDFKVLGGYDFVNDNDDPMDDHFHGTHVAGTVAAKGTFQGVAPDAALMAYKVLDSGGAGGDAGIVAAIEQAVLDGVHIMNLSLGGAPNPDGPMSIAIDNATRAGVLCVVSAGNSGPDYYTLGAPGDARLGLSVGASNFTDGMAVFSSRGPSDKIFHVKPDVVAPGVTIHSSMPGNGHARLSGTSMSAPVVAGLAALLLEVNPDLTADELKSLIMNTADDIGKDVYTQGSGRVNAMKAAAAGAVLMPGSVDFGITDLGENIWSATDTLILKNLSDQSASFSLDVSGNLPPGTEVVFSQENVTLNGGDQTEIIATLSVDNSSVPFTSVNPPTYNGILTATSESDTLKSVLSFIKSPMMQLTFDQDPLFVLVHDRSDNIFSSFAPVENENFLLSEGSYDLFVLWGDFVDGVPKGTLFIKEGIEVEEVSNISVVKGEAEHTVTYTIKDIEGEAITGNPLYSILAHKSSGIAFLMDGNVIDQIASVSDEYRYEAKLLGSSDGFLSEIYEIPFYHEGGISEDLTFENDPEQFKQVNLSYSGNREMIDLNGVMMSGGASVGFVPFMLDMEQPLEKTLYFLPEPVDNHRFPYSYHTFWKNDSDFFESRLFETARFNVRGDTLVLHSPRAKDEIYKTTESVLDYRIGMETPFFSGVMSNVDNHVQTIMPDYPFFFTGLGTTHYAGISYQLYGGGRVIDEGRFNNTFRSSFGISLDQVQETQFEFHLNFDQYHVGDLPGIATAKMGFDISSADNDPPHISNLAILDNGVPNVQLSNESDNTVTFSAGDDSGALTAALYYRPYGEASWIELDTENEDNRFEAELPEFTMDGFYSLYLHLEDATGNYLMNITEPAFKVSGTGTVDDLPAIVELDEPADEHVNVPHQALLSWVPSDHARGYQLQISEDAGFETISRNITGIADTSYEVILGEEKSYYWKVRAVNMAGTGEWSEVRSFTTKTATSAGDEQNLPITYELHQNFPNPFNPSTSIRYSLPEDNFVSLRVFDILGREVAVLAEQHMTAGTHTVQFNSSGLSSGVYIYRLQAGDYIFSKSMMLVK